MSIEANLDTYENAYVVQEDRNSKLNKSSLGSLVSA